MLPGFLTTALEIIIILDICGAIVYFALSGLMRSRETAADIHPLQPAYASPMQVVEELRRSPSHSLNPYPGGVNTSIYTGTAAESPKPEGFSFTAGIKQHFTSLKSKLTYRPTSNHQTVETRRMDGDQQKLGQILDSFREET